MTKLTGSYIYMASAHCEYKIGDDISTTWLNNGATLGTSGFKALDVLESFKFVSQTPKRARVKKSGFNNYRVYEGVREPAEFEIVTKANSGIPLVFVHGCATTATYTHTLNIPAITAQQPNSTAGALPKLAFRVEGMASDTNAKEIVDLIGCVITELNLEMNEEDVGRWTIRGTAAWILRGQTKISSAASDVTTTPYAWAHVVDLITFTYGGTAIGFNIKGFKLSWKLEWEVVAYQTVATIYTVASSMLLKNWDFSATLDGLPYQDGTAVNVKTWLSTAVASLSATVFTVNPTRTTSTDDISYSMSLMQPAEKQENLSLSRESSDYERMSIELETKEDHVLTGLVHDALAESFYENTA